jgi:hypothetical protein
MSASEPPGRTRPGKGDGGRWGSKRKSFGKTKSIIPNGSGFLRPVPQKPEETVDGTPG